MNEVQTNLIQAQESLTSFLKEITDKLFFLKKEKDLTALIIDILQKEKIIDLSENLRKLEK